MEDGKNMSKLDALFEILNKQKNKIEMYTVFKTLITNFKVTDKDIIGLQESVRQEIVDFIDAKISEVENSVTLDTVKKVETIEAAPQVKTEAVAPKPIPQVEERPFSPLEKQNFAMKHRHAANKQVLVMGKTGEEITGKVVMLDAPHFLIKTDAGPTIKVLEENITFRE